ncbi:MAG: complex I subunit 5 family protein [Spirochaetota bacterium]
MNSENSADSVTPPRYAPVSTHEYVRREGVRFRRAVIVLLSGFVAFVVLFALFAFDAVPAFPALEASGIVGAVLQFGHYPLVLTFLPFAAGPVVATLGKRVSEHARDLGLLVVHIGILALIVLMLPQVRSGMVETTLPGVLSFGLHFRVDMLSYVMVATGGVLWLVVGIYARDYMVTVHHRDRFYLFLSITYGGVLGTVMASDILTMFLFFEVTTFSSYLLVTHNETNDSIVAGSRYLFMGVAGGLAILLGVILMQFHTDHMDFSLLAQDLQGTGSVQYIIASLFVLGFGLKAGMLPLHIWLPRAHPVAPTPASALLSGFLIKIGTYGMLRVTTSFFMPGFNFAESRENVLWALSHNEGTVIIWLGIATMAVGVFMALQQSEMKKMLAYHSISQMGYIIMGIGVASYLGYIGAMGFAGSVYHTVNHALFKSLLFMVVGFVYLSTGRKSMYELGGLWRKMPVTAMIGLIAALGITGMPGFNGFASKSILHHAIDEAWHYGHYSFRSAEVMFTIVSAGTVASFIKLYYFVFLRKPATGGDEPLPWAGNGTMQIGMSIPALLIVALGVFPGYLMETFIIPAARVFNYDPAFIDSYLRGMEFFTFESLWSTAFVYLLGGVLFAAGIRFELFHLQLPGWLNVERVVYRPLYNAGKTVVNTLSYRFERRANASDVYIYTVVLIATLITLVMGDLV